MPPDDLVPDPVPEDPAAARSAATKRRLTRLTVAIAVAVVLVDQLTKVWAVHTLEYRGEPVRLLGSVLSLRLLYNSGAALSIAMGMTWLLTIIVIVVVVIIARVVRRIGSVSWAVALGLLLGGALGNLTDRLVRPPGFAQGYVVDFIDYAGWFVGNVADIAIVGAAGLIIVLSLMGVGLDGRQPARGTGSRDGVEDGGAS